MRGRSPRQWNEFKETAARRQPDKLYATLNSSGAFVINRKTWERMNEPQAVVLLYDRDTKTIGLRPSRLEVPNALLVHARHARYNRVIRCKAFLTEHRIEIEGTIQFPTAQIDTDGVLILNLRERVAATHMPKRRGGQFK